MGNSSFSRETEQPSNSVADAKVQPAGKKMDRLAESTIETDQHAKSKSYSRKSG
jgi:hypothetical protein